jgi:alpha-tubulin suppressor-like RCC1 family protein
MPDPMHVTACNCCALQIVCGGNHTLALSSVGEVYTWGQGTSGQLGLGSQDNTCRYVTCGMCIVQHQPNIWRHR